MKTITQLKEEQQAIRDQYADTSKKYDLKQKKKDLKRLEFLYACQLYLESEPKEEFVESEIDRLEKKLERIEEAYPQWKSSSRPPAKNEDDEKNYYKSYKEEMGVADIRKQITHLNFLLT